MKLISCNVHGRVRDAQRRQLDAILERDPTVVALQEVTTGNYGAWTRGLMQAGYSVLSTIDLLALPYPPPPYPSPPLPWPDGGRDHIQRRNFNLLASRAPLATLPGLSFPDVDEARYAFPEKYVAARVTIDGTGVDIHNAHLPPGVSRGEVKVHHFEAIRRRIDEEKGRARVLCGDFNAPWSEDADGPLPDTAPEIPDEEPSRWTTAELGIVANPEMRDVYRDVHDASKPFPASYVTGRKNPTPHRYDYIFASRDLTTNGCEYLTAWLDRDPAHGRLSDHAPVEAILVPASTSD